MRLQLSVHNQVSLENGMISRAPHGSRMRTVDPHLLEEKMDEAVTHYINSHPSSEVVHADADALTLSVQDSSVNRVVTVMHSQNFPSQMCSRQVAEHMGDGPWTEELLDPEGRLAALVAQIAQNPRTHGLPHHKVPTRSDVDSSVMLESPLRLYNGQTLEPQQDSLVVDVQSMPPLPPLQHMKRCQETDWFNKAKTVLKDPPHLSEDPGLELTPGSSPASRQPSRKSLPHKKRISRKLKRSQHQEPVEDIVVINCSEVPQEEILPDTYSAAPPHLAPQPHHEMRAILICQLCGEFFGEEQLKFYHHLKQHYEPHAAIIIDNPVPDLSIDKITNACIVDNVATLPDSIVELSLENTLPKTTIYQPIDKHIIYSSKDKTFYMASKSHYSIASLGKDDMDKDEMGKDLYESVGKVEVYSCTRCNKSFKKQKHCEAHIKEAHSRDEELNEFSEPEDLMEGIHVAVEEELEHALPHLPHLTVDTGAVRQEHARHWYLSRDGSCAEGPCSLCAPRAAPDQLKEDIIQRIFDVDVHHDQPSFAHGIIQNPDIESPDIENPDIPDMPEESPKTEKHELAPKQEDLPPPPEEKKSKRQKKFTCAQCGREFNHRNSLLYHALSHAEQRPHACHLCPKSFYTRGALKIHWRVHNGERPYKCGECGRLFRQWGDLRYHVASLHSEEKNFKCDFCGKQFARKYSLNVHRKIHTGQKDYQCAHCTKTFRTASYRATHERTHTGYKPHKCAECDKAFRVAGDLRRHMLIHEKAKNRGETDKKSKKSPAEGKQIEPENIKKEPVELKEEKKVKKIATASTTRQPVVKTVDKKQKQEKNQKKPKKGAPNVVVTNTKEDSIFKGDYNEMNGKMKEIYSDQNIIVEAYCRNDFEKQKDAERFEDREFATLRPMYRAGHDENPAPEKELIKENTDGKLAVFTHLETKGREFASNSHIISDIRQNIELRERGDTQSEVNESVFLERLTAMYNVPV